MHLIEFPEQTTVIARDQKPYLPMPAHMPRSPGDPTTMCWKMSWKERFKVLATGVIWHRVKRFGDRMQPQLLLVDKPEMI